MSNYSEKTKDYIRRFGHSEAARQLIRDARQNIELSEHLLRLGAAQEVQNAFTSGRKPSKTPSRSGPSRPISAEEIILPRDASEQVRRRWMDEYHLYGSDITLAKATAKDLKQSADKYHTQGLTLLANEAFERAVAKRLEKTGKSVEQVFTDETLKTLKASLKQ